MIIRENVIEVEGYDGIDMLEIDGEKCKPEELIFFDLEHYVYKKPKCIGVFGACIYNNIDKKLYVTQYMIENKGEVVDILVLAKKYFIKMKEMRKKSIVTFSGNNDYTVINYLFKKYNINFNIEGEFKSIDIQKEYEKNKKTSIGLKNLEKIFEIFREGEVISGSNLAKTFHKVLKDDGSIWISGTYHCIHQITYILLAMGYYIINEVTWFKPNAAPNLGCRCLTASHETLIWAKKNKKAKHTFNYDIAKEINGGKQMRSVWEITTTPKSEKLNGAHPTQKPLKLMERIIRISTNPGDTVLDPFCGSSSTGVAANKLNRKYIGIDISEEFLEISKSRIEEINEGQLELTLDFINIISIDNTNEKILIKMEEDMTRKEAKPYYEIH